MRQGLELEEVWSWCVERLGTLDGPWKLPVLATTGRLGPRSRVVVARKFNWPELHVYSDSRAGKIEDIRTDSRVSLAYYDQENRVQIRLRGTATIHTDSPEAVAAYEQLPPYSRGDYLTRGAPGSLCTEGHDSQQTSAPHFALIEVKLLELEWLSLRREGHLRASFLDAETGRWLVP